MAGYDVLVANDGVQALEQVQRHQFDLILLDLGLPHINGFEVLERVRQNSEVPIIVLTALDTEDDKVRALMMGADDYLPKPFGNRELQARIVAVLRRARPPETTARRETVYVNGSLRVDLLARNVTVGTQHIHLTPTEYRLLVILCENVNSVLTHDYLLAKVWGNEYSEDVHILRATIWRLRQKIEGDPGSPTYIVNEPGIGYRFVSQNGTSAAL